MTFDQRDNGGLFAVRDGDLVTLTPVDDFPDSVAAVVFDHLDQIVGEPMVNVTGWPQHESDHKPAVLAFDQTGMLTAVVLAGANDGEVIVARVQATLDWLTELTLRDVLGMHESVDSLVDRLLDLNPNEVHLSLDPGRRIVIVTLGDLGQAHSDVESIAPNLTVVDLEVFADPSGTDSLIRRIPSPESAADLLHEEPSSVSGIESAMPEVESLVGEIDEGSSSEGEGEPLESDDQRDQDDRDQDDLAEEDSIAESPDIENVETPIESDIDSEAAQLAEADETDDIESSLAPPPPVLPNAILTPATFDDRVVELPFVAGRSLATSRLLASLGELGKLELFDDGTVVLGEHVLLTQVLSDDADLDSPTHFHRAVDDASVARFQSWYDGDLANVRFHLVVRNAATPTESTYIGELKPTAWEHMSGGQQLLFKIVPRIGAALWQQMSNGQLPPVESVLDLTGPTVDQELQDVDIDLRDGALSDLER